MIVLPQIEPDITTSEDLHGLIPAFAQFLFDCYRSKQL
jgi:hypothetical protein